MSETEILEPIVITTESPKARRQGWLVFIALQAFLAVILPFAYFSAEPARRPDTLNAVLFIAFIFTLTLGSFGLIYLMSPHGTWTIDAQGVTFEPRRGATVRLAWDEIAKVKWTPMVLVGASGEKIVMPNQSIWMTSSSRRVKDAMDVYKLVRERLAEPFGYDDWREKSTLVWSDPTTWMKWMGEMIFLIVFAAAVPAIGLITIRYDLIDNEDVVMLLFIGGICLPLMILFIPKYIRQQRFCERKRL